MTFDEFLQQANRPVKYQRAGQVMFNTLYAVRPCLANQIRGGGPDPFYRDDMIPAFLEFVENHWNDDEPQTWKPNEVRTQPWHPRNNPMTANTEVREPMLCERCGKLRPMAYGGLRAPEFCKCAALSAPEPAAPSAGVREILSVLFDGDAVFKELDDKARRRTSTENVSDVLDAVVRLLRIRQLPEKEG